MGIYQTRQQRGAVKRSKQGRSVLLVELSMHSRDVLNWIPVYTQKDLLKSYRLAKRVPGWGPTFRSKLREALGLGRC